MLEVITAGLLSSVQDCGRPGYTELGVPVGGACDRFALAQANLLLGNAPGAAALELTLSGPELGVLETCTVGLAGADLRAEIPEEYRNLAPRVAHLVRAGTTIRFGTATDGARAYLALAAGIAVPVVLGSAAT